MQEIKDVASWTVTYEGIAPLGKWTDKPKWSIRKTLIAWGITTYMYPRKLSWEWIWKVSDDMLFIWDNRATLEYALTDDLVIPTLSTVSIASDNLDTTLAKVWDTITLTIISTEELIEPVVTIAGQTATVTIWGDKKNWTAAYTIAWTETEWLTTFSIAFTDLYGHAWAPVTAVTDASTVTIDYTLPTLVSAIQDIVTQFTVTLSELALASTITKANDGWFIVYDLVNPLTTYAISAIAPGATDDLVVLTCADTTASLANWFRITYANVWNGTVSDKVWNLMATDATWVTIAWV